MPADVWHGRPRASDGRRECRACARARRHRARQQGRQGGAVMVTMRDGAPVDVAPASGDERRSLYDLEAELFAERARALTLKVRSRLAMATRLRDRMAEHLLARGVRKLDGDDYTVYLAEAEAVVIDCDPGGLPAAFLRPREPEPDREGLRKALRDGQQVAGVRLERKPYVIIR